MIGRAVILLATLLALAAKAAELPRPPIAVNGLEMVLPGAVLGGREVSTARFRVAGEARQAAEAMARAWRSAGASDVIRRDSGQWQIVSRIVSGEVETIQLRDDGVAASTGLISRWSLQPVAVRVANHPQRLLPPDARQIDQLVSRDGGRVVVTTVAVSARAVGDLANEVATRARELGFTRRPVMEAARAGGELDVAFYRKSRKGGFVPGGGAELVVTIERRAARSAIVLHLVEGAP